MSAPEAREAVPREAEPLCAELQDGTVLRGLLVRSADPGRLVLLRTPYGAERHLPEARSWAAAGWTAAVLDVRGRYNSGGQWDPYSREGADGAEALAALIAQGLGGSGILLAGSSYGAHCALETSLAWGSAPGVVGVVAMVPALGRWETAHAANGTPHLRDRIGWWAEHGFGHRSEPGLQAAELDRLTALAEREGPEAVFDDERWRALWSAPRVPPAERWGGAVHPLFAVGGEEDFFADHTRELEAAWGGPVSSLWGPWGHTLAGGLPPGHPDREALRSEGGLMGTVRRWARHPARPVRLHVRQGRLITTEGIS